MITPWESVQAALADVTPRLGGLLRAVSDPSAPAVGDWSVEEAAVHLAFVFAGDAAILAHGERLRAAIPVQGPITPAAVSKMNAEMLESAPDRDLAVIASRIEKAVAEMLGSTSTMKGTETVPWLGGLTLPATTVAVHLLSEALVHGFDIARGARLPWRIEREHALLFVEEFLLPLLKHLPPASFVNQEAAHGFRGTFEVRIRGGRRTVLAFRDGGVHVLENGEVRPDCRISADPVAFTLVGYGRIPFWRPALTGKLVAGGRKPWLAAKLPRLLQTP